MRQRTPRPSWVVVPLLSGLLAAPGCGEGPPPMDTSKTEARITGTVKIQGKAAEGGGQISFNPSNAERQVGAIVAPVGPDGTYAVTTFTGDNIVKFSGPMLKDHQELALASRYCPVAVGEQVVDFDLLGETDKPRGATYSRKKAAAIKKR